MPDPEEVFQAGGDVDRLTLRIPLHSVDTGLFLLMAVVFGGLALFALAGQLWFPEQVTIVLAFGMLASLGIPFVPRLSDEERLDIVLTAQVLRLQRHPLGAPLHLPLETLSSVEVRAGDLTIQTGDGEHRFPLSRVAMNNSGWLCACIEHAASRRRIALQGEVPAALEALKGKVRE